MSRTNSAFTTTTTAEHSNSQTTTHQLDANATAFDPISCSIGDQMQDKQFTLFSQLQQLNTTLQQLQYQLNTISIPTLTQINQQMLNANINQYYISNPVFYLQLQQQQNAMIQTVQFQQSQANQLQNQINIVQNQYQISKKEEIQKLLQQHTLAQQNNNNNNKNDKEIIINKPQPTESEEDKTLSIIIEESSDIKSDDKIIDIPQSLVINEINIKEEDKEQIKQIKEDTPQSGIEEKEIVQDEFDQKTDEQIDKDKDIESKYSIKDLLTYQAEYMEINWINNQNIPREIRIIYKDINGKEFMNDIIASISRKVVDPFQGRKISKDKKTVFMRKLQGTLNKMTPTKFDKIASDILNIISGYVIDKQEMEDILGMILEFGIQQSIFSDQYAKLIKYIFNNLPDINNDISLIFRSMVIMESNKLFAKYNDNKLNDKKQFISFLKICGDLYNINMINSKVIYKGIIDTLLKNNITPIDIEAICMLFEECGNKLDNQNINNVNKYIKKIKMLSKGFDFRTQCLIDGIEEMREKDWKHRIEKEKPKDINEIKKEFDEEQQRIKNTKYGYKNINNNKNKNKYENGYDYEYDENIDDGYYSNNNNNNAYSRYHRYK